MPTCLAKLQKRSEKFLENSGRRPRILLSCMNKDAPDCQVKALAVVFADAGFDVDIGSGFSTHRAIAKMACENDVHVVGISGPSQDQDELATQLARALADFGEAHIKIHIENQKTIELLTEDRAAFEALAAQSADRTLTLIGA